MPDIRLIQDTRDFSLVDGAPVFNADGSPILRYSLGIDWSLLGDGTLDESQALASAIILALGTNRLAEADDVLPDLDSSDRGGWWGDLDAKEIWDGWPIGSKLWLLRRAKIVGDSDPQGSTVYRVEEYIREAITPFIDARIASRFEVEATRSGIDRVEALVTIYRGPSRPINLRFEVLWDEIVR